jgi:hypothetical protein
VKRYRIVSCAQKIFVRVLIEVKVLDPSSKRSDRLLFEVEKFRLLDSDSFSTVTKPVDVLLQPSINAKIQQLKGLMDSTSFERPRSQPSSPVQSQFATQAPGPISKKPSTQPVAQQRAVTSNQENLLSILTGNKGKSIEQAGIWHDSNTSVQQKETLPCPPVLSQISEHEVVRKSNKLDSITNARQNLSSQESLSSKDDEPSIPPRDENLHALVHVSKKVVHDPPPPFTDLFNSQNPFVGKKRIPRRFVRVPREQQQLLDRDDTWYAPASESRQRYATIPIQVRESLVAFHSQEKLDLPSAGLTEPALDLLGDDCESGNENGSDTGSATFVSAEEESRSLLQSSSPYKKSSPTGTPEPASGRDNEFNRPEPSWCSSPAEQKGYTLATLGAFPTPTLEPIHSSPVNEPEIGRDIDELPNPSPTNERKEPLYIPRLVKVDYPSSSGLEADLEEDELHAVGEYVEIDNNNPVQAPRMSQELPWTAPEGLEIVEVEQSPFRNAQVTRLAHGGHIIVEASRAEGVSSDAIIPATCTQPTQSATTCTAGSNEGDQLVKVLQEVEGIVLPTEGELTNDDTGTFPISYPEDRQKPQKARSVKLAELDIPSSPPNPGPKSTERWASIRRSNSVTESLRHSYPQDISPEAEDRLPVPNKSSSPQLPAPWDSEMQRRSHSTRVGRSHGDVPVKRVRHRAGAAATLNEEVIIRDTEDMVRSERHRFIERRLSEDSEKTRENPPPSQQLLLAELERELPESVSEAEERKGATQEPGSQKSISRASSHHRQLDTSQGPAATQHTLKESLHQSSIATNDTATDFYQKYVQAYPDYPGSKNNFTWALVYVEWLRRDKQLIPRLLIDDVIRVMSSEYIDYVLKTPEPRITGWYYFVERILNLQCHRQVITPENLERAISTLDQVCVGDFRAKFDQPRKSDPIPMEKSLDNTTGNIQKLPAPVPEPQSSPVPPLSRTDTSKSSRRLPWTRENENGQTPRLKKGSVSVEADSPNLARNGSRKLQRVTSDDSTSHHRRLLLSQENTDITEQRGSPASPILGTQPQTSLPDWHNPMRKLQPTTDYEKRDDQHSFGELGRSSFRDVVQRDPNEETARVHTGHGTKRKLTEEAEETAHSFKRPRMSSQATRALRPSTNSLHESSLSALESASARTRKNSDSPISLDGTSKARVRLNKPLQSKSKVSFADFLKRRRDSGAPSSRLSTPASTPGKRYCVKPKALVLPNGVEAFERQSLSRPTSRSSESLTSREGGLKRDSMAERMMEPETQPWT